MVIRKQTGYTLIELSVVLLILVALAGVVIPYVGGTSSTALCNATDVTMQNVKKVIMERYYLDTLGHFPSDKGIGTNFNLTYLFIRDDGLDNNNDGKIDRVTNGGLDIDTADAWQPFDSATQTGWRGAYLQGGITLGSGQYLVGSLDSSFQDSAATPNNHVNVDLTNADTVVLDGWGRPIVLQVDYNATTGVINYARLVSAGAGSSGIGFIDSQNNRIETPIGQPRPLNSDDRLLYLNIPTPAADVNPPCNEN